LINTVPVAVTVRDEDTLETLLDTLRLDQTETLRFSHSSLADVQKWSKITSRELFCSILTFENYPSAEEDVQEIKFEHLDGFESVDVQLAPAVFFQGTTLNFKLMYQSHEVGHAIASNISQHFLDLVNEFWNSELDVETANFDKLTNYEQILWDNYVLGERRAIPFQLMHEGVENQANITPFAVAIEEGARKLSYRELEVLATKVAANLQFHALLPGAKVAVIMERCLEFPVASLGVLKAGGVIVPIDSSFPAERIEAILNDSGSSFVATTSNCPLLGGDLLRKYHCVVVDDLEFHSTQYQYVKPQVDPSSAYTIFYTSGTTGKPKGVMVTHMGHCNYISSLSASLGFAQGKRALHCMAIGFDMGAEEIWCSLTTGTTLVLPGKDIFAVAKTVNILIITPTGLSHLGNPTNYPNLTHVNVAGEPLPPSIMNSWKTHVTFTNNYGPTEISINSHFKLCSKDVERVNIGRVVPNMCAYVLDTKLRPIPFGTSGELYIGGVGVALGYINLPELTSSKFIENPFHGGKMFKTGDGCRLNHNGEFELQGRLDDMVKVKGYRIELDEVSHKLTQIPEIEQACAVINDGKLVGFYSPPHISSDQIRNTLLKMIPHYMVPSIFVGLEQLPVTVNGKINKLALQKADIEQSIDQIVDPTEKRIAQVWADVLNIPVTSIGRNSSFFELGGDSLSAIKVVSKLSALGLSITVADVFANPFIFGLNQKECYNTEVSSIMAPSIRLFILIQF
jgi:amino acid adenylation domain-containing protein